MVMKKKAQAAMEFLMTYGWAILVVLVVIGALAYFGVLNPQNLLPEKCTLPMGLYCKDHLIKGASAATNPNTISFKLENGMGEGIVIRSINVTGDILKGCGATNAQLNTSFGGYNNIAGWHLANGDSNTVKIGCNTIPKFSGKTKGDITLVYCDDTSANDLDCTAFSHTMNGELLARVE